MALAVALGLAACNTDSPTSPKAAPDQGQMERQGPKSRGQSISFAVNGPLTRAGEAVGTFAGTFNVTRFGFNEATRQLMVTGVLNGTETFTDGTTVPVTNMVVTTTATLRKGDVASTGVTSSPYQFASSVYSFAATCGILALDLGPLHLDLLGLVVDLNEVILTIVGETGAGNLLGNLLCALTGLLDGFGALAAILNLIDAINGLLGAIGGLATPAIAPFHGGFDIVPHAVALLRST